ncbi:MAG: hypothetical protein MUO43_08495 [Desulfobacterales bacterium]|nr:hypothetical protein [Desulfobacterales bacterium]
MLNKTQGALVIGIVIWVAGALMIMLFGQSSFFPLVVVPAAFLAAPTMYIITKFYLRDVPVEEHIYAATRLGVAVTAVQFPLDAMGWFAIFNFGYPPLTLATREAVFIALEVGYFWLLVIPWWVGKRKC